LKDRLRRPTTGLGPGMELFFCVHAPRIFRLLPQSLRLERVRKMLGPAPGWFIKNRIAGKVPFHLGAIITRASVQDSGVELELTNMEGRGEIVEVDHVIAATGYRIDLARLDFLSSVLRQRIRLTEKSPALSADFESSVRGLYFVGVVAANTFGPLMRFAYGSEFVASSLAKHFSKLATRVATVRVLDQAGINERS
ncbi:MAG: NAD(P)/FAD-dependent oxidoreductase, partial [Terracidiphilus sp.]